MRLIGEINAILFLFTLLQTRNSTGTTARTASTSSASSKDDVGEDHSTSCCPRHHGDRETQEEVVAISARKSSLRQIPA
jgi:hypothetical protein